jgi:chaperone required for assembly of F1-ATPase
MSPVDVTRTYANCASRPIQLASIGRARDIADADRIGLLALAVARGFLSPEAAWRAAHIDEDFQAERWGEDTEGVGS